MEINLFRLCSGLKVIGYFMILLVAAIVAVSYYAVVVLTWGPELRTGGLHSFLAISIIVAFHFLLIMLLWCYFMVVFRDPGSVPENWKPRTQEEILEAGSSLTSFSLSSPRAVPVAPDAAAITETWSTPALPSLIRAPATLISLSLSNSPSLRLVLLLSEWRRLGWLLAASPLLLINHHLEFCTSAVLGDWIMDSRTAIFGAVCEHHGSFAFWVLHIQLRRRR